MRSDFGRKECSFHILTWKRRIHRHREGSTVPFAHLRQLLRLLLAFFGGLGSIYLAAQPAIGAVSIYNRGYL